LEQKGTPVKLTEASPRGRLRGTLQFHKLELGPRLSFCDYIQTGLRLNLITAIDFSSPTGTPAKDLHRLTAGELNPFEICIQAVGSVACHYDSDQFFPVYGFGAFVGGKVEDCFPLTVATDANVRGLDGILNAYRTAVGRVDFGAGPCFAPVIKTATAIASAAFTNACVYTILLIVTNGNVHDLQATVDAIVAASVKSISIVIAGIGTGDFGTMTFLDANTIPLRSSEKKEAARDIVQFAAYAHHMNHPGNMAAELLAEIPRQVEHFCVANNVRV
jgi:hypothetical protein